MFLQEFCGYCVGTDTSHEIAVWLHSPPGGGKSTFLAGTKAMLGHRAAELGLRELSRSRFALATLPGKTLVTATEQPAGFVEATDLLNKIISGDPLQLERKYHDPIDIIPRCKILWAMNDLPRVSEASNGIFRRVKVVEMDPIPEGDRNPEVRKGIEKEGAGILNWALEGLRRLDERGHFDIPASVEAKTEEFQKHNDIPALFLEERCEWGDGSKYEVSGPLLYDAYKEWCLDNRYMPKASNKVSKDFDRLGLKRFTRGGYKMRAGVRLLSPARDTSSPQ